jgi:hypothetical protein
LLFSFRIALVEVGVAGDSATATPPADPLGLPEPVDEGGQPPVEEVTAEDSFAVEAALKAEPKEEAVPPRKVQLPVKVEMVALPSLVVIPR